MTREQIDAVLEDVRFWPKQDQEELAGLARDIQARRSGVYVTSNGMQSRGRKQALSFGKTKWRFSGKREELGDRQIPRASARGH